MQKSSLEGGSLKEGTANSPSRLEGYKLNPSKGWFIAMVAATTLFKERLLLAE